MAFSLTSGMARTWHDAAATGRIGAVRRMMLMHALLLARTSRDHRQFGIEALQVELAYDAVVRLLDQELARTGLQLFA